MWHLYMYTVDLCDYTQLMRQVMVGTVLKSTYEPHGAGCCHRLRRTNLSRHPPPPRPHHQCNHRASTAWASTALATPAAATALIRLTFLPSRARSGAHVDRNATFRLKFLERRTAAAKDVGEVRCGGGDVLSLQLTERDRQVLGRLNDPKRCLELHRLLVARAQLVARLPVGIADARIWRSVSGLGGALRAASRSFSSPPPTMTWNSTAVAFSSSSRSVSALTMPRSLLAAALGGMSCRPSRSLRRAAASPRAAGRRRALMSSALARRGPRHASSIRKNVSDFCA